MSHTMFDLLSEQSYLFRWDRGVKKVDVYICRVSASVLFFSLQMYLLVTAQNYLWLVLQHREHKTVWGSRR